jgi:putative endonuclease
VKAARQRLGRWGEELAREYLLEQGYSIIEVNARTPYGEIDLIANQPGGAMIFVEVKTRRSHTFGPPEISVTPTKRAHIQASVQFYLMAHPEFTGEYRVDVIAIQCGPDNEPPEIVHFENAIS